MSHNYPRPESTMTDKTTAAATSPSATTNAQSLIKLDGVTKVYYTDELETHALSGIQLDILEGEYVAIAGPSGGGKTTLLSILGLLDSPTQGVYLLGGQPVESLSRSQRADV